MILDEDPGEDGLSFCRGMGPQQGYNAIDAILQISPFLQGTISALGNQLTFQEIFRSYLEAFNSVSLGNNLIWVGDPPGK